MEVQRNTDGDTPSRPVLFLVYINDIEDAIRNILRLFADDTKLFGCTNTDTDIEDLQLDNDDLDDWSGKWLLKFNVGKCCTLHYGYNNPNHTYQMYENGIQKEIVNSDTVKDLGITFDTELKFRKHINDCINKGNRITGLIRRSFLHINCKSFNLEDIPFTRFFELNENPFLPEAIPSS